MTHRERFLYLVQHWLLSYFKPGCAAGQSMRFLSIAMSIDEETLVFRTDYDCARDFVRAIISNGEDLPDSNWIPEKVLSAIKSVDALDEF